jgi:hypothetical protein
VEGNGAKWRHCLQYIKLDNRIVRSKSESETRKETEKGVQGKKDTKKRSTRREYELRRVLQA